MHWNIGNNLPAGSSTQSTPLPPNHPPIASSSRRPPASCPMHSAPASSSAPPALIGSSNSPAKCPIQHSPTGPDGFNPLNIIPKDLSSAPAPGQSISLPTDRESSTIPRPKSGEESDSGVWEYPSPQQFYNALVRKGWETPEESMEMVVAIHNFLNERAWEEVMKWEKRLPGGEAAQLERFQGRPGELSPKARMHLWAGKLFPSRFNTEPPFDRHDWIVTRPVIDRSSSSESGSEAASKTTTTTTTASTPNPRIEDTTVRTPIPVKTTTTRYVIDYYSAPPDEDGNPVFSLDVRPALDNLESVKERVFVGLEEWMNGEKA